MVVSSVVKLHFCCSPFSVLRLSLSLFCCSLFSVLFSALICACIYFPVVVWVPVASVVVLCTTSFAPNVFTTRSSKKFGAGVVLGRCEKSYNRESHTCSSSSLFFLAAYSSHHFFKFSSYSSSFFRLNSSSMTTRFECDSSLSETSTMCCWE
jgi:hypothetical protein